MFLNTNKVEITNTLAEGFEIAINPSVGAPALPAWMHGINQVALVNFPAEKKSSSSCCEKCADNRG